MTTKEQLRELIILDEFKNCVPSAFAMYINEHKVIKLSDVALMADDFVLTHVSASYFSKSKLRITERNKKMVVHQNALSKSSAENASFTRTKGEMVFFYCRKPGHKISDCAVLRRKDKAVKPIGLISTSSVNFIPDKQTDMALFIWLPNRPWRSLVPLLLDTTERFHCLVLPCLCFGLWTVLVS